MTFEKVMEIFKNYLKEDKDIEVVKLNHGYYIFVWDSKKANYVINNQLIQSPKEMFDELYAEAKIYYESMFKNKSTGIIEDKQKRIIDKTPNDLRKEFCKTTKQ